MIVFVTGTGTGVGKTVFTTLLVRHWRANLPGRTFAMKPFCSGGREDAELLTLACQGDLKLDEVNPWHFEPPLAPLPAARMAGSRLTLSKARKMIRALSARCDHLVIEGAGGLLSPLGEDFDALRLIQELGAQSILVAPNRLGVLNEVRLSVRALAADAPGSLRAIVLVDQREADASASGNRSLLVELLPNLPVLSFPVLELEPSEGTDPVGVSRVKRGRP